MSRITAVLLGLGLTLAGTAVNGSIVTISVQGYVTSVDDSFGLLGDTVRLGDPLSATYAFESTTADTHSDPGVGDYWSHASPSKFTASAGGLTMQSDPQDVNIVLEVCNNDSNNEDCYYVCSYGPNLINRAITLSDSSIHWTLFDSTGTALSNDTLPTNPPDLSKFLNYNAFDLIGATTDYRKNFTVRCEVTSAFLGELPDTGAVPEPATFIIWSLLGTLAITIGWRRRKAA